MCAWQDNIEAVCTLAFELEMPQLLSTADEWLVHSADKGSLMDVPSLSRLQNEDNWRLQDLQNKRITAEPIAALHAAVHAVLCAGKSCTWCWLQQYCTALQAGQWMKAYALST